MNWRVFRIAIILGVGLFSATNYSPVVTSLTQGELVKSLLLIVPVSLLALLSVIGFQAVNPVSKKVWLEPSWDINPFTLSQPLVVFHFLACIVTVQALVNLVVSIIKGDLYEFSLIGCVAGLSILAGVRLVRIVFRRKFQ
ncbi:hypothetical protein [Vibrio harveyi]|uniref:hypothetical protein n=1 Tax=Vibrio harveyi TaxID=669 RepID=UPI003398888A